MLVSGVSVSHLHHQPIGLNGNFFDDCLRNHSYSFTYFISFVLFILGVMIENDDWAKIITIIVIIVIIVVIIIIIIIIVVVIIIVLVLVGC